MAKFLLERAFDLWGPQSVTWAIAALALGLVGLSIKYLWRESVRDRLGPEAWLAVSSRLPILLLLVGVHAFVWTQEYSATPIGVFYSGGFGEAKKLDRREFNPLAIPEEVGSEHIGFTLKVRGIEYHGPHRPILRVDISIDADDGPYTAQGNEFNNTMIPLKANCYARNQMGQLRFLFVVLNDTFSDLSIGYLVTREPTNQANTWGAWLQRTVFTLAT